MPLYDQKGQRIALHNEMHARDFYRRRELPRRRQLDLFLEGMKKVPFGLYPSFRSSGLLHNGTLQDKAEIGQFCNEDARGPYFFSARFAGFCQVIDITFLHPWDRGQFARNFGPDFEAQPDANAEKNLALIFDAALGGFRFENGHMRDLSRYAHRARRFGLTPTREAVERIMQDFWHGPEIDDLPGLENHCRRARKNAARALLAIHAP